MTHVGVPRSGAPSGVHSPRTAAPGRPRLWKFTFRFWRQIDGFGLDAEGVDVRWCVSLLEKLQDLSRRTLDEFLASSADRDAWRWHKIRWDQPGIPVRRSEFTWIDPTYLDNDDDFPFYQFQISQALGRVVGFLDEDNTFNVVLLDPMHNMQPTKRFDYRVGRAAALSCHYSVLLAKFDQFIANAHRVVDEVTLSDDDRTRLKRILSRSGLDGEAHYAEWAVLFLLDDAARTDLAEALDLRPDRSHSDLIRAGIDAFLEG